jgi:hypothetical protein
MYIYIVWYVWWWLNSNIFLFLRLKILDISQAHLLCSNTVKPTLVTTSIKHNREYTKYLIVYNWYFLISKIYLERVLWWDVHVFRRTTDGATRLDPFIGIDLVCNLFLCYRQQWQEFWRRSKKHSLTITPSYCQSTLKNS